MTTSLLSKLFNFLLIVGFILITTAITVGLGGPSEPTPDFCDYHPQRSICDQSRDPAFREFAQDRAFGG